MDKFYKLFWKSYAKNCEIEDLEINPKDYEIIKKMDKDKLYKQFSGFV